MHHYSLAHFIGDFMRNKQSAWCIFSVLILVGVVGFVGAIPNVRASEHQRPAGTNVSGIISTNTVWNLAGSPYNLTGKIQIAISVTLTIESGVVVNGNNNVIQPFGTLAAIGNASSSVVFNDVNIWAGENISTDPPYIINIRFARVNRGGIYPNYGSSGAKYGTLWLRDSFVADTANPSRVWQIGDIYIERNVFYRSGGIQFLLNPTPNSFVIHVRNNLFLEQKSYFDQVFAVESVLNPPGQIVVEFNSFLSSDRVALSLPPGYQNASITAVNNYWGGVSTAVIDSMIFDKNDDLGSAGVIAYSPFLSSPHPDTPLFDPPTPTPTATSTSTSTPTATTTSTSTPTATTTSTSTPTATTTSTSTPTATTTSTPTPTATSTIPPPPIIEHPPCYGCFFPTQTPTPTPTVSPTATIIPQPTNQFLYLPIVRR